MKCYLIVLFCSILSFSVFNAEALTSEIASSARKQCDSYISFYQRKCKKSKSINDNHILHYQFETCGLDGKKVQISFRNVPSSEPPLLKNHLVCIQEVDNKAHEVGSKLREESVGDPTMVKKTEINRYFENAMTKEFIYDESLQTRRSIFPDKNFYIDCTTSNKNEVKCRREIVPGAGEQRNLVGFDVAVPSEEKMNEIRKGASVTSMTTLPVPKPPGAVPDAQK